jgi:regulator of sigma D
MIDDKQKVLACFDKRFEEYNEEGYFNIYHIVLEDEKGNYNNYGIYANGILAESTMEKTLSKLNNFDLINIDKSELININKKLLNKKLLNKIMNKNVK